MKTGNAIIVGCILISISIIYYANTIAEKIYPPPQFPSALTVTTNEGNKSSDLDNSDDFISFYEAARYLRIDNEKLEDLIKNGRLDGTFTSYGITGGRNYIFSVSKLAEWMMEAIENGEYLY